MREIKTEVESMRPEVYRRDKDNTINSILISYGARDSGMSVAANLELLDIIAFGLADLYQEYRNRLFFTEDILRKQYQEFEILEREEAKDNIRKRKMFIEKNLDLRTEKTNFEKMTEDMGIFFEPQEQERATAEINDKELFILKSFLKENGISQKYFNKIIEFGDNQKKIDSEKDKQFVKSQFDFGKII